MITGPEGSKARTVQCSRFQCSWGRLAGRREAKTLKTDSSASLQFFFQSGMDRRGLCPRRPRAPQQPGAQKHRSRTQGPPPSSPGLTDRPSGGNDGVGGFHGGGEVAEC